MQKKIILSLALMALVLMPVGSAAAGNVNNGYEPLYWNGPEGSIDYNILFEGSPGPGHLMRFLSRRTSVNRACSKYSRKYLRTGRRNWLRKYDSCLADYN